MAGVHCLNRRIIPMIKLILSSFNPFERSYLVAVPCLQLGPGIESEFLLAVSLKWTSDGFIFCRPLI